MACISSSLHQCHKEIPLFPSNDDLFDQYVDPDSYGLSDNTTDRSASDEWEKYFDFPDSHSGGDAIPLSPQLQAQRSSDFDRAYWAEADADASDDDLFSGLLDFSHIERQRSSPSPYSPNFSNTQKKTTKHTKHTSLDLSRPRSNGVRKPSQRLGISPNMAQPSVCRRRNQDTWAQRIEANADKFDFTTQNHLTSPPLSATLPQVSWNNTNFHLKSASGSGLYQDASSSILDELSIPAHEHFTPLASPVSDTQGGAGSNYGQSPASSHLDGAFTSPGFDWSFPNHTLDPSYEDSLQDVGGTGHGAFNAMQYPAPAMEGPDSTHVGRSSALSPASTNQGLMINYNMTHASGMNYSTQTAHHHLSRSLSGSHSRLPTSNSQPAFQPGQAHNTTAHRLSQQPLRRHFQSGMRPPTPPTTPRSRKGSRGPASHHKRSKTATGISERRSGMASSGAGFVNYTPDDSRKILTGVAPSGSSKTKARREKEAADKRRTLSMVAAKAVMEAGGDVDELRRCGLLLG